MKEKEKIKAEISRLQGLTMDKYGNFNSGYSQGEFDVLCILEAFIDSLPEDTASKGLEEELDNWRHEHFHGRRDKDASGEYLERESQLNLARHFADWQKQQIMSKAFDAEVKVDAGGYPYIDCIELYDYDKDVPLAKKGDKVKLIIIKEE